jgi:mannose-6-phosphate isomerase-like protein (cupin superfamily)
MSFIMKFVKKAQAKQFENSPSCFAYEYPLQDEDINGAVIELSGRYPERGLAVNEASKELVYVVKGQGILSVNDEQLDLSEGDMVLILPGEKYFFEGELKMLMPCSPAWRPEQHKIILNT